MKLKKDPLEGYTEAHRALFKAHDHMVEAFLDESGDTHEQIAYPETSLLLSFMELQEIYKKQSEGYEDITERLKFKGKIELLQEMIDFLEHKTLLHKKYSNNEK